MVYFGGGAVIVYETHLVVKGCGFVDFVYDNNRRSEGLCMVHRVS